ncbi:acyltransferase [Curtobacterium sp. MCBD17_030]|uniref:acyltransferase family protein n=1 Tax=Curtobacterium sp. MCBD17_030 TaxID=2175649 RepID=UPI000D8ACC0D|nr:acyltransferase [Curtobacterium sp. MCBD17_030]PYY35803.1 acyltransferase [Curtobacterium sp. MCBD17_030]
MVELQAATGSRVERFSLLDGLRFAAALAVVAYHYLAFPEPGLGAPVSSVGPEVFRFAKYGAFGVDLFFVISGFVILMSGLGRSAGAFVASRISRLYPAYWLGVLSTAVVVAVAAPGHPVDLRQVLVNLTMLHPAFGVGDVDPVYWTLWIELHFYVIVGVLLLFKPAPSVLLAFALAWPVVAALAQLTGSDLLATTLIAPHAPLFAAGMAVFCIYRYGSNSIAWLVLAFDTAFAVAVSTPNIGASIARNTDSSMSSTAETVMGLACVGVVVLVTLTPLSRVSGRWLTTLGALTYPLYLLHQNIGVLMIHAMEPVEGRWAATGVTTVLLCGVAYVVSRYVERPVGRALRRRLEGDLGALAGATRRRSRRAA